MTFLLSSNSEDGLLIFLIIAMVIFTPITGYLYKKYVGTTPFHKPGDTSPWDPWNRLIARPDIVGGQVSASNPNGFSGEITRVWRAGDYFILKFNPDEGKESIFDPESAKEGILRLNVPRGSYVISEKGDLVVAYSPDAGGRFQIIPKTDYLDTKSSMP